MKRMVVLIVALLGMNAHAQITYPLRNLFAQPVMQGFRQQSGDVYTARDATMALKTRKNGLLERANVELTAVNATRAGQIFGAITGFGAEFGQSFTTYVERNAQGLTQPGGVTITAETFLLTTQIQNGRLRFDVRLVEVPQTSFEPVAAFTGNKNAAVVVRVFSDFECPYCEKLDREVMMAYRKNLPADVRLEFHHLPLESIHPRARAAAEASECANEQGRFWAFHDALFMDRSWVRSDDPNAVFLRVVRGLGINLGQYQSCVQTRKHKSRVDAGIALGSRLGISGTPTVFVGGFRLLNAYSRADLERMVNFVRP
jgi:protein-disulfide isomerase